MEIKKPILNKYLQHKISFRTGFACRTVTTQSVAIQIMLPYVTMILTACQLIFDFLLSVFHNQFIKYDFHNPATHEKPHQYKPYSLQCGRAENICVTKN